MQNLVSSGITMLTREVKLFPLAQVKVYNLRLESMAMMVSFGWKLFVVNLVSNQSATVPRDLANQ